MSRIGLPKRPFHDCPNCRYPMVSARAYNTTGSSSDHPGLPGLDPDLPYGKHDLDEWWQSRFDPILRYQRELNWFQSIWDFLDGFFRRAKLRGLREAMRRDPDGLICPNCLHWLPSRSATGFGR